MTRNLMIKIAQFINNLETFLPQLFRQGGYPPTAFALAGCSQNYEINSHNYDRKSFSLEDVIGDGILWAVPKHRRTVEKRLNRKFGHPFYNWKPLKVKTHLRTCNQCGHDHEVGVLCPHCYNKVREETKQIQDKIQEQLALNPIEHEVIVLYEGEKKEKSAEELKGKRIVELEKPRPMWFSKNLMQKTTQPENNDETKEIKPTELG